MRTPLMLLMSIHPNWTHKIITGLKDIEVRKTIPKSLTQTPFQMFIHCTKDSKYPLSIREEYGVHYVLPRKSACSEHNLNGRIVGTCLVTEIIPITWDEYNNCYDISDDDLQRTCLSQEELLEYGNKKTLYGYVISNLRCFTETYHITKAFTYNETGDKVSMKSAPQSWSYINGLEVH